jgi:hypothetical protein
MDDSIEKLIASYSNLPFKAPLFDFPDDSSWLHEPGYKLPRFGTAELATLGRFVIPMLSSGFSEKAIGILFVLAYNLRRPTKGAVEYVFQDHELGLGSLEDMNVFDLSDNLLIRVREPFYVAATTDLDREAMYYSFIAASIFRMSAKPPENYESIYAYMQYVSKILWYILSCETSNSTYRCIEIVKGKFF